MDVPTREMGSVCWDKLSKSDEKALSNFNVDKESITVSGSYWCTGVIPLAGRIISKRKRSSQNEAYEEEGR